MKLVVIWSPQAKKSLDSLVEFLEQKWSVKVIRDFLREVDSTIYAISKQPLMYPYLSEKKEVHKCVIKKKTLLLYKVSPTQVELLKFIDSRQNPSKYSF
mgnify:CR=1 FL=1